MANFEIYGPKNGLTQWDINRKMIVSVMCDQVHFSNRLTKKALVCEVYNIGDQMAVDVPNILLQNSEVLEVYAYVCNADESYTKVSAMFPVTGRPKPEDYVYTETEVLNYKSLNDRIKQLEQGGASADDIAKAVEDYMKENPIEIPDIPEIPEALPNPHKLTITGAVQAEYDGSKRVEIEIPYNEVTESQHKYELLEKITIEDGNEIASIVMDEWVLDAVAVRIIAPTEAVDASIRVYFKHNDTNLASHQIGVTSKQWTVLTLTKQLGYWQFVFFKQLHNAQAQLLTQPRYYNTLATESFPNIGRIELAGLAALTGGTTIEILGVRHESES